MPLTIYLPHPGEFAGGGEASEPWLVRKSLVPQKIVLGRDVGDVWLRAKSRALDPKTISQASFYLASFADHLDGIHFTDCKQFHLEYWLLDNPQWESEHTRQAAQSFVVTAWRWAAQNRLIDVCPFRRIRNGPLLPRMAIRPDEFRAMLSAARDCNGRRGRRKRPSSSAFRKIVWFLWETGARTCEARECCWQHLDWEKGIITLDSHKTVKVTGVARVITLTRAALRLLRMEWRRRQPKLDERIFITSRGGPWECSGFCRHWRNYSRIAGIRASVSAYCLRHGFVVDCIETGLSEREVADLVGHKGTRYVEWYSRSLRNKVEYLRRNLERVR